MFSIQNDLDDPDRGMLFVCSATHKTKSMYFFLVQTEQVRTFVMAESNGAQNMALLIEP